MKKVLELTWSRPPDGAAEHVPSVLWCGEHPEPSGTQAWLRHGVWVNSFCFSNGYENGPTETFHSLEVAQEHAEKMLGVITLHDMPEASTAPEAPAQHLKWGRLGDTFVLLVGNHSVLQLVYNHKDNLWQALVDMLGVRRELQTAECRIAYDAIRVVEAWIGIETPLPVEACQRTELPTPVKAPNE